VNRKADFLLNESILTDPPSPRPPWWVFWLVRPHKVSYKVSILIDSYNE